MAKKKREPKPYAKPDQIQIRGNEVFCPLRERWLKATPEERVRQEFILFLRDHYGYALDQMAQERKTQHGRRSPKAHAKHDVTFNAERTRLCTEYGPRIAAGDTPAMAAIMREAEAVGLSRQLPEWKLAEPPKYPRGVGMTTVGKPRWTGEPTDKKRARDLKKQFEEVWTDEASQKADALTRELRLALRNIDRSHNAALWREVREIFDYPVFTAAPDAVGITSTGADGPNRLPDVLKEYRLFVAWVADGARPSDMPDFNDQRGSAP